MKVAVWTGRSWANVRSGSSPRQGCIIGINDCRIVISHCITRNRRDQLALLSSSGSAPWYGRGARVVAGGVRWDCDRQVRYGRCAGFLQ